MIHQHIFTTRARRLSTATAHQARRLSTATIEKAKSPNYLQHLRVFQLLTALVELGITAWRTFTTVQVYRKVLN